MSLVAQVKEATAKAIEDVYKVPAFADDVLVNQTKPEFEGDYTVVLFALIKQLRKAPEQIGQELGEYLVNNNKELFTAFNVIKGFLNLTVADNFYTDFLSKDYNNANIGHSPKSSTKVMVEYSSPNTNK